MQENIAQLWYCCSHSTSKLKVGAGAGDDQPYCCNELLSGLADVYI